jgi:glycosyltransferase involved in cell wall biosynthesis
MKKKYLISIVTINKNNGSNLQRTIISLREAKSDPDIELIFIDGASTDNSLDLARDFYKPENLITELDSGIYCAMNKGLYLSHGKYVLWLNSGDELISDDFVKVKTILKTSQADLISFCLNFLDKQESSPKYTWIPKKNDLPFNTLPHPSTFFKRDYFLLLGGYKETFKIVGDREALLRMYFAGCSIDIGKQFITNFYLGGISSTIDCKIENLSLSKSYDLISTFKYYRRFIKLHLRNIKKKLIGF